MIDVGRIQHDPRGAGLLLEAKAGAETVACSEGVVEDDHVRALRANNLHEVTGSGEGGDTVDRWLANEQALEPGAYGGMVIDDKDTDLARGRRCCGGGHDSMVRGR
jgi:hypothetical protein